MRYALVSCLLLAACAPVPQNIYKTPHEQFMQKCSEAGFKDKEFEDCVSSATNAYNEDLAARKKEIAIEVERRNQESIKARKDAEKRQLAAEDEKCIGNGLKKGTASFATCKAINRCVNVVHNTQPPESYMAMFYKNFDAFYNPATGLVQNNAKFVGDQDPLFVFQKCMTAQGIPLH